MAETPRIQIDSDWKKQAQAEKERLAQQTQSASAASGNVPGSIPGNAPASGISGKTASGTGAASGRTGGREMPPASFATLVSSIATQALFALGAIPDPRTGQRFQSLELARHHIDMLGILEDKTKGNLTAEEADMLASTAYELRSRYIQIATESRQV